MTDTLESNVITVDFRQAGLPVGQVVSYFDRANPRKMGVVIAGPMEWGEQPFVMVDGEESTLRGDGLAEKPQTHAGWQLVLNDDGSPQVMSDVEMATFVEQARAFPAEQAKAAAQERADRTATLLAKFSYLTLATEENRHGPKLAAQNIRKMLAREFPGTKFSVTSSKFSGGNSVDVSWNDGPSRPSVDAFIDRFQSYRYNSEDDSSTNLGALWPTLFGGARFVHGSRTVSGANYVAIAAELELSDVTVDEHGVVSSPDEHNRDRVVLAASERSFT